MTLMDYLKGSHLFLGVNDDDLKIMRSLCYYQSVKKGTEIFKQGEQAEFLYVVGKGRVALDMTLERPDGSTTPPTTVASVGPGDAFGWPVIGGFDLLNLSARAIEDCGLGIINVQELGRTLSQHPKLGYIVMGNIASLLSRKLADTREAFVYERSWLIHEKSDSQIYR